jgi:hypothetical protein
MILDNEVKIKVSSKILHKLKIIGIDATFNEIISLPVYKLWHGSNIKVNVRCDICGNEKKLQYNLYIKNTKRYNLYCCNNICSNIKNKLTCLERYGKSSYVNIEKSKKTKLEKYGDENYQNVEKSKKTKLEKYGDENYNNREKYKMTCVEKYGVENPLLLNEIKDKIKKTNIEKYGVEDSRKSNYVKKKRKETIREKYGVDYYIQTDDFKIKSLETNLLKYGYDSPNKSELVKLKKVQSMLKKYGFISNSITEESKSRLRKTNMERYGVEYPMQFLEFIEKQQKNSKKINYFNEKLYYQSSYEKDFLILCEDIGIIDKISRGPSIKYELNNKSKFHFPDFYIKDYNLIIEIKSSYYYKKYLEQNIKKMNTCIEIGYNYLFIINKNYEIFKEVIESFNSINK